MAEHLDIIIPNTSDEGIVIEDKPLSTYYSTLPKESNLKKILEDTFVINEPLEEVGGDCYWVYEFENMVFISVFDCMGHGKSANVMTKAYIQALNNVIVVDKVHTPDKILLDVHLEIKKKFADNKELIVGCAADIAVLRIDFNGVNRTLHYAGAKTALVHNLNGDIDRIKGDRIQVGDLFDFDRTYTSHSMKLPVDKKAVLFLFSDGVTDLVGGVRNKKLGYANLQELLERVKDEPFETQKKQLKKYFKLWSGPNKPVDDLLFTGLKI
ncbi:PP2C family protein-serine/threonine phosphatase [Reichenbachiella versicolor]|uniref:PP2C family protein-serine/threonine phosphatase n=1 Tax=Reichenbachiella versicolor TaxID=1821036 RepID=UPI000D6E874D|nr:SpoIIE family protein phosphatase [Reichenbachiella versicolor]